MDAILTMLRDIQAQQTKLVAQLACTNDKLEALETKCDSMGHALNSISAELQHLRNPLRKLYTRLMDMPREALTKIFSRQPAKHFELKGRFSGKIPAEIGCLVNLAYLSLHNTNLNPERVGESFAIGAVAVVGEFAVQGNFKWVMGVAGVEVSELEGQL
ncbi:hypothetical protein HDU98_006209 [Podochytrium sp. JEL0797]|nr:hypothetical protein HDU98_006209 [Podochytrium sp. JEL0797]